MSKHTLSVLVENKPGVLARIAGLFSRRGFNIDTLAVGPTDDPTISRVTLTVDGALHPIDQVTKQLHKLVNVLKIRDLEPDEAVAREMALFKISADAGSRGEIMQVVMHEERVPDIPDEAVCVHTRRGQEMGRGMYDWFVTGTRISPEVEGRDTSYKEHLVELYRRLDPPRG